MDEKKLLKKIRKGDQESLNILIETLYPEVYRYVYVKMSGHSQSADITQETFIRFVRGISTYKYEGKVQYYLFRIASNLCIDYFRKESKNISLDIELNGVECVESQPDEVYLRKLNIEEIMLFVGQLSSVQQDVILLRYFEQLGFKEISKVLDISESTAKSRHVLALKKLEILMKGDHNYEGIYSNTKAQDRRNKNSMH